MNVSLALLMLFPIIVGFVVGDWFVLLMAAMCLSGAAIRLADDPPFWWSDRP